MAALDTASIRPNPQPNTKEAAINPVNIHFIMALVSLNSFVHLMN
jgi:hypothetical protein